MSITITMNDILHQIRLKRTEGGRRSDESTLTVEEICAAIKERGDFSGNYDDLVKYVKIFFDGMSHQLSGGVGSVVIDVEERAQQGYIEHFTDTGTYTVDDRVSPGRKFIITDHNIKIEGNKADCGVWFISAVDASLRFKVTKALAENSDGRVSGVVPVIPAGKYSIEVKTQYNGGGALLKVPRTIKGGFVLRNYRILTVEEADSKQ